MSFLYADGYFPFCPSVLDGEGNPYVLWDGVTYTEEKDMMPGGHMFGEASRYNDRNITVVGPGTYYPFGLSLEEMAYFYWRAKKMKISLAGTIDVDAPGLTKTGYWKVGPDDWRSEDYSIPQAAVSVSIDDPARELELGPVEASARDLVCNPNVAGGIWFPFGDNDSHSDGGAGGGVSNTVGVSVSLNIDVSLSHYAIFCDGKYWPKFAVYSGVNPDAMVYTQNSIHTQHGWDVQKNGGGSDAGGESKSTRFVINPYSGVGLETLAWPIRLILNGASLDSHVQIARYASDTYPLSSLPTIDFTVTETRDL